MKKRKASIESVINRYDTSKVSSAALKEAIELHRREETERKARILLEKIKQVDRIMESQVKVLRNFREMEKRALAKLHKLNVAQEKFMVDGDFAAFEQVFYS